MSFGKSAANYRRVLSELRAPSEDIKWATRNQSKLYEIEKYLNDLLSTLNESASTLSDIGIRLAQDEELSRIVEEIRDCLGRLKQEDPYSSEFNRESADKSLKALHKIVQDGSSVTASLVASSWQNWYRANVECFFTTQERIDILRKTQPESRDEIDRMSQLVDQLKSFSSINSVSKNSSISAIKGLVGTLREIKRKLDDTAVSETVLEFMKKVQSKWDVVTLDSLTPELLEEIKSSGLGRNFKVQTV